MSTPFTTSKMYNAILKALSTASHPLTNVELAQLPQLQEIIVQQFGAHPADQQRKMSDKLVQMWRRELVDRYAVAHDTTLRGVRYAYSTPNQFDNYGEKLLPQVRSTEFQGKVFKRTGAEGEPSIEIWEQGDAVCVAYKGLTIRIAAPGKPRPGETN
ncbi:MAG: hypothetical protein LBU11_12480 [Zoogloeaceae bacterium]|jgi:hypothetical protein|nr:hypothetical protein [Zoogloeaceae bacterium]